MENKKIVLALSGGMDSATLLGYFLDKGYEIHVCHFQYGAKHNYFEYQAFLKICRFYKEKYPDKIILRTFSLEEIFSHFNSNLLLQGEEIPEGHYNDANMKKTVVPGRNLIFSSIMAGLAESIEAEAIALGIHAGDHHIYPDCRPEFIIQLQNTINASSEGKLKVFTPFLQMTKENILHVGYSLKIPVPYKFTRTCYKQQSRSCGKCGSCTERLEAFEKLGIKDPIDYE